MLPLLLASGVGLLAFGTLGLWNALQDAEARTRLEARRATVATAGAVRRTLRSSAVLELVPEPHRFEIRDGGIERHADVAAALGFPEAPERDLPAEIATELAAARRLASEHPDRAAAILAELQGSPFLDSRSREFIALQRGWYAHRAGSTELRDACLAALGGVEDGYREVVSGALLLSAACQRPPADSLVDRAAELDDELAAAIVERMRELGAAESASRVESRCRVARQRRQVHATVGVRLAQLLDANSPLALPVGDSLLLYYPAADGAGVGALVGPGWFCERLRQSEMLGGVPWSAVIWTGNWPADTELIVPGLLALGPEPPADVGWNASTSLSVVIAALAVCFIVALIATFRVMRAETAAVRARSDFLQSVTHELKTPLASIRLLSERLETGRVDAARSREYYGMLADEATRLSVLIDNVLDLGRIERGERAYDMREHDVGSVVEEAVEVFSPLAQRDGITLEVDGDLAGVQAIVDRGALVQALLNVLENARKYAKDGARIVLRAAVVEGRVALDVRDFGPGVPAAERDAIFERFRRGDRHHDGSVAGVGLGLHLARSILEAHHGEMDCVAPDGPGALFRMRIPLEVAS